MMPLRIAITLLTVAGACPAADIAMDSARGERLFRSLNCIGCHRVNGEGGMIGPDLSRRIDRNFTPAGLASTMWNHAPTMWTAMREQGVRAGDLDEQGASDLFAWFYSARFFEKAGDAGRGKRLFTTRHCEECHGASAAKPFTQWAAAGDPIALVAAMWTHSAAMKFTRANLNSQDLADILVYVRNTPDAASASARFELGSSEHGQALFGSKGCEKCHTGKLVLHLRGQTLTDLAADMWNHSPLMSDPLPSLNAGEMRDVTSYIWARQFFAGSGNPLAGKRVFASKHCLACHADSSPSKAPSELTGSAMVSVLWRHGPQMLEQMKKQNIIWPRFDGADMSNLIAYLNSVKKGT